MIRYLPLAALLLAGCASTGRVLAPDTTAGVKCDSQAIADLVGRPADATLGAEAMKRAGARTIRWLYPDSAMTMDYRVDRLNVKLDAQGKVTGFTCG